MLHKFGLATFGFLLFSFWMSVLAFPLPPGLKTLENISLNKNIFFSLLEFERMFVHNCFYIIYTNWFWEKSLGYGWCKFVDNTMNVLVVQLFPHFSSLRSIDNLLCCFFEMSGFVFFFFISICFK